MRQILKILIPLLTAFLYFWQGRIELENVEASLYMSKKYDDSALTVVTYNIRGCRDNEGEADPIAIAEELGKLGADIIALQEVDNRLPRSGFVNQAKTIAQHLQMNYVYAPSINFLIGTYGNALLSNRPILSSRVIPLPFFLEPRSLLDVVIDVNGSPFHVYTTHLGLKKSERIEQLQYLREYLHTKDNRAAVLLGDFNTRAADPLLAPLRAFFQDPLFRRKQELVTVSGRSTYGMIDHIFLSHDLTFVQAYSPMTGRSDHYPVTLQLELPISAKKAFAP
ncbi:endonuclease/exonuclease/phosphatase family protein [Brevibacillus sp. H7]|uniref:endonuclease/exonuclease/phosphatase family protein n=1 Tax=Brevibacillus sp. H7 TaxID=3349138 RepID=UPI0037FE4C18